MSTFEARLTHRRRLWLLGRWPEARDAALAHDRAVLHFGLERTVRRNFARASSRLGPASPDELCRLGLQARVQRRAAHGEYRGVFFDRAHSLLTKQQRWRAFVSSDRGVLHITNFDSAIDAALAHDRVARHLLGARATLNFPDYELTPASIESVRVERRRQVKARMTSRLTGVTHRPDRRPLDRPWHAQLIVAGVKYMLGSWGTEEQAGIAHDRAARHYVGKAAALNFPGRAARPADATALQAESRAAFKRRTSSRYRGVSWDRSSQRWHAQIQVRGVSHFIGAFRDEVDAARAYDGRASQLLGRRAVLNFP